MLKPEFVIVIENGAVVSVHSLTGKEVPYLCVDLDNLEVDEEDFENFDEMSRGQIAVQLHEENPEHFLLVMDGSINNLNEIL